MSELELIILYPIIDDLLKEFYKTSIWEKLKGVWINKRRD